MDNFAELYDRFVRSPYERPCTNLTFRQSMVGEKGFEVWRLLKKRYGPKTTLRNLQLELKIMSPGYVKKEGPPCSSQSLGRTETARASL